MSNFHKHWFTTPPSNSKPNLAYKQARINATQILFYLIKGRFGLEFDIIIYTYASWRFRYEYLPNQPRRYVPEIQKKEVKIKILHKVALEMVFREKGSSKNANTVVASIVFHAPLENISTNERKLYRLSWTKQWSQSCT